jgi:hypothetical protein
MQLSSTKSLLYLKSVLFVCPGTVSIMLFTGHNYGSCFSLLYGSQNTILFRSGYVLHLYYKLFPNSALFPSGDKHLTVMFNTHNDCMIKHI